LALKEYNDAAVTVPLSELSQHQ